jgi:hypothetical protein
MGAALLVPAAISALSAGVGYYNNQQTLAAQNRAATQGLLAQQQLRDQAAKGVNDTLTQIQRSNPQAAQQASNAQFVQELQRSRAAAAASTPPVMGANARYGQAVASGQKTNAASEGALAKDMSGIMAPELQRLGEHSDINTLASQLSQLAANSRGQGFLTQLKVGSTQPNPWLSALAAAGQGAASGLGSRYAYKSMFPAAAPGAAYSSGAAANQALAQAGFGGS